MDNESPSAPSETPTNEQGSLLPIAAASGAVLSSTSIAQSRTGPLVNAEDHAQVEGSPSANPLQPPSPALSTSYRSNVIAAGSAPHLAGKLDGMDMDQPEEEQFVSEMQADEVDIYSVLPEIEGKTIVRSVSAEVLPNISESSLPLGPGIDMASPVRIQTTYRSIMECLKKGCGDGPSM